MKMKRAHWLVFYAAMILPIMASNQGESASLGLPAIFSSNMVIQRDKSIHVWGKADSNETIRVEFAGQSAVTVAHGGEWEVWLDPEEAGGPYELNVYGAGSQRSFQNVMVGDVWIASGQSNMALPLQSVTGGTDNLNRTQWHEANKLVDSQIRLFKPTVLQSDHPLTDYLSSGWRVASYGEATTFSAVGFFFGGYLNQSIGVPIGLVQLAKGSTPAQTWMSIDAFQASEKLRQIRETTEKIESDIYNKPAALYNGLVAPLHKFPVKGVIWYQGESNGGKHNPDDYGAIMTALINDWRQKWNDPLPFLTVQLTGYSINNQTWTILRDEQRKVAQANEKVGLAITIDVGEKSNIHPTNKMAVGYRLALQARCLVYGEDTICTGPTYVRAERQGDEVFAEPVAVMYAWSDFPEASLFNLEGLPAGPFFAEVEQAHQFGVAGIPQISVLGYPTGTRKMPHVLTGVVPIEIKELQPNSHIDVTLQPVSAAGMAAPIQLYSGNDIVGSLLLNTLHVTDGAYDLIVKTAGETDAGTTQTLRMVICNSTPLETYLPYLLGAEGVTELSRIVVLGQQLGHLRIVAPKDDGRVAGEVRIRHQGLANLVVKQVLVTLAPVPYEDANQNMQLYAGTTLPDHIQLDTLLLPDGPYTLSFSVTTIDGKTTTVVRRISVDNWIPLEDLIEPPLVNGWFGTVSRLRTEAASSGWEYVGDKDDLLFGDIDRIQRKASTDESLMWNSPRLQRFSFTVYTRSSELDSTVQVAVSVDTDEWTPVAYSSKTLEDSGTGWQKISIEGVVSPAIKADHIRLTISGDRVKASDLQLGSVLLLSASDISGK